jgi:hypothetical protein
MADYEIMDFARQGITLAGIYFAMDAGVSIRRFFSEKIKSQKDLDRMIEEESTNLDLDSVNVFGVLKKTDGNCLAKQYTDNIYGIIINEKDADRCSVRHELYHIHKHRPFNVKKISKIKKVYNECKTKFVEEPQAVIYETLGIKL